MENSVNMLGKCDSPRSPTRLQRKAPAGLHLDRVPENPFSPDAVATTAIPLLSPLFVSPTVSGETEDFKSPVGSTEKKGSQPSMDHKEGWQYSAKADHSDQIALLDMFQTKFVLVDHSQGGL